MLTLDIVLKNFRTLVSEVKINTFASICVSLISDHFPVSFKVNVSIRTKRHQNENS